VHFFVDIRNLFDITQFIPLAADYGALSTRGDNFMQIYIAVRVLIALLLSLVLAESFSHADEPAGIPRNDFEKIWAKSTSPLLEVQEAVITTEFDSVTVDIGEISVLDGAKIEVRLSNANGRDLQLTNVNSSCGCMVGHIENDQLISGGDQRLRIILSPMLKASSFSKRMDLYFKDVVKPTGVILKGVARPSIKIEKFRVVPGEHSENSGSVQKVSFNLELLDSRISADDVVVRFRQLGVPIDSGVASSNRIDCFATVCDSDFGISLNRDVDIEIVQRSTGKTLGVHEVSLATEGHVTIAPALPSFRKLGGGMTERLVIHKRNCDLSMEKYLSDCTIKMLESGNEVPIQVRLRTISVESVMAQVFVEGADAEHVNWDLAEIVIVDASNETVGRVRVWGSE
jgi:hypothetical protein